MTAPDEALRAEVAHWKAHAEEAGAGFARVCREAARLAARNTELGRERDAQYRCAQDLAAKLARLETLFAGGPDTPCRTTWPDGVECVEVPMDDLRSAFGQSA